MAQNTRPRRVPFISRRAFEELKQMLRHNHGALHQILEGQKKTMTQGEDLKREVAETKAGVRKLLTKMQELIDTIKNNPNDQAAIAEAVAELDALQTEMTAATEPPTPPVEPAPEG